MSAKRPKVVHVYSYGDDVLDCYVGKKDDGCHTEYLGEYAPRVRRRREQIGEWWEVCSKQCMLSTAHDLADAKRQRREMRRDGFIGMLRIVHVVRRKVCR